MEKKLSSFSETENNKLPKYCGQFSDIFVSGSVLEIAISVNSSGIQIKWTICSDCQEYTQYVIAKPCARNVGGLGEE